MPFRKECRFEPDRPHHFCIVAERLDPLVRTPEPALTPFAKGNPDGWHGGGTASASASGKS